MSHKFYNYARKCPCVSCEKAIAECLNLENRFIHTAIMDKISVILNNITQDNDYRLLLKVRSLCQRTEHTGFLKDTPVLVLHELGKCMDEVPEIEKEYNKNHHVSLAEYFGCIYNRALVILNTFSVRLHDELNHEDFDEYVQKVNKYYNSIIDRSNNELFHTAAKGLLKAFLEIDDENKMPIQDVCKFVLENTVECLIIFNLGYLEYAFHHMMLLYNLGSEEIDDILKGKDITTRIIDLFKNILHSPTKKDVSEQIKIINELSTAGFSGNDISYLGQISVLFCLDNLEFDKIYFNGGANAKVKIRNAPVARLELDSSEDNLTANTFMDPEPYLISTDPIAEVKVAKEIVEECIKPNPEEIKSIENITLIPPQVKPESEVIIEPEPVVEEKPMCTELIVVDEQLGFDDFKNIVDELCAQLIENNEYDIIRELLKYYYNSEYDSDHIPTKITNLMHYAQKRYSNLNSMINIKNNQNKLSKYYYADVTNNSLKASKLMIKKLKQLTMSKQDWYLAAKDFYDMKIESIPHTANQMMYVWFYEGAHTIVLYLLYSVAHNLMHKLREKN